MAQKKKKGILKKHKQLNALLIIFGLLTGYLTVLQFRSFEKVQGFVRDTNVNNIFHEVQILKLTNDELEKEIFELTAQLESLSDGNSYRKSIRTELEKNGIIAGLTKVAGPGVIINIDNKIAVSWLVDLVNELWTAGADAVAINSIRISPYTVGFESFNEQIYLNKLPIRTPYKVEVIGNSELLEKVLTQQGSISARLDTEYPDLEFKVNQVEKVEMDKVF